MEGRESRALQTMRGPAPARFVRRAYTRASAARWALRLSRPDGREIFAHQSRHAFCEGQSSIPCADVFEIRRALPGQSRKRAALRRNVPENRYSRFPHLFLFKAQGVRSIADCVPAPRI